MDQITTFLRVWLHRNPIQCDCLRRKWRRGRLSSTRVRSACSNTSATSSPSLSRFDFPLLTFQKLVNYNTTAINQLFSSLLQGISDKVPLVKAVVPKNQSHSFITQGSPDTMVSLSADTNNKYDNRNQKRKLYTKRMIEWMIDSNDLMSPGDGESELPGWDPRVAALQQEHLQLLHLY